MKVTPKRSIVPAGKRISSQRPRTNAERTDANLGGTETDVVPLMPPSARSPEPQDSTQTKAQLDPEDELTPG